MKIFSTLLAAAACLSLTVPTLAQTASPSASGAGGAPSTAIAGPITIALATQNASGESGTATIVQSGPRVVVMLRVKGAPKDVPQPVHIHVGTCAKLTAAPMYPLTNMVNGKSDTVLSGVTVAQLLAKPFAINAHKSTTAVATYVACGNIDPSNAAVRANL